MRPARCCRRISLRHRDGVTTSRSLMLPSQFCFHTTLSHLPPARAVASCVAAALALRGFHGGVAGATEGALRT